MQQYAEYEQVVLEDRIEKEKSRRKVDQEAREIAAAIKVTFIDQEAREIAAAIKVTFILLCIL